MSYQRDGTLYLYHNGPCNYYSCIDHEGVLHKNSFECRTPQTALAHLMEHGDEGQTISSTAMYRLMAECIDDLNAQDLYDLREITGFCSGSDLHELFDHLISDPSPPGCEKIPTWRMVGNVIGEAALALLVTPLRVVCAYEAGQ